jgi:hypothetical protein
MSDQAKQKLISVGFLDRDEKRASGFMTSREWGLAETQLENQDRAFDRLCELLESLDGDLDDQTLNDLLALQQGAIRKERPKRKLHVKRVKTAEEKEASRKAYQKEYNQRRLAAQKTDPEKREQAREWKRKWRASCYADAESYEQTKAKRREQYRLTNSREKLELHRQRVQKWRDKQTAKEQ